MAVTAAQVFITSDGKKFDNELDANTHEMLASVSEKIEAFLNAAGVPTHLEGGRANPRRAGMKNTVARWLAFEATGTVAANDSDVD